MMCEVAICDSAKKDDPPRFGNLTEDLRRIVKMTLKQIAALGKKLLAFLALFSDCFGRCEAIRLLQVYVKGQLSDVQRKTCEAMALKFRTAPRTLQRFIESIKWDEEKVRDRCQEIVATEHGHPDAVGIIDESGTAKSGTHTVGADRQYNGNRGKIENCTVGVHLSYSAPGFQCLIDSDLYLTEGYANDPQRRKKTTFPTTSCSAPSRRLPLGKSTGRSSTASRCGPGRSTNCMAATTRSSTRWKAAGNGLWGKFPATFMVGSSHRECCEVLRKTPEKEGVERNIPVWRGSGRRAKRATWCVTRRSSASSAGNVTGSKTPTGVRTCGKSSGRCFGGRMPKDYQAGVML
jgi:hypothetical protein